MPVTIDGTAGVTAFNYDSTGGFYETATTIATSYTITTNYNAMSVGPVTINTGVVVTIPTNSTWVVV